jgi:hypothetical protein
MKKVIRKVKRNKSKKMVKNEFIYTLNFKEIIYK